MSNNKNTEIPALPINKTQKRLYPASSDPTYSHATFETMVEYINGNPTAFLGQILFCEGNDSLYRIARGAEEGQKIPEGIGAALKAENVSYNNPEFPELTNLKLVVDHILANLGNGSGGGVTLSNEVYYGVSDVDGITTELNKEIILTQFNTKTIEGPNPQSDIDVEREFNHVKCDFGINTPAKYFYIAIPYKNGQAKARDLSAGFGDGWFNWSQEESSSFLKTITLPNKSGLLEEYILLRSDNMLQDGSKWLFYFK